MGHHNVVVFLPVLVGLVRSYGVITTTRFFLWLGISISFYELGCYEGTHGLSASHTEVGSRRLLGIVGHPVHLLIPVIRQPEHYPVADSETANPWATQRSTATKPAIQGLDKKFSMSYRCCYGRPLVCHTIWTCSGQPILDHTKMLWREALYSKFQAWLAPTADYYSALLHQPWDGRSKW
jgi:hypothetical protein